MSRLLGGAKILDPHIDRTSARRSRHGRPDLLSQIRDRHAVHPNDLDVDRVLAHPDAFDPATGQVRRDLPDGAATEVSHRRTGEDGGSDRVGVRGVPGSRRAFGASGVH